VVHTVERFRIFDLGDIVVATPWATCSGSDRPHYRSARGKAAPLVHHM
jgi:hypothetical protein